MTPSTEPVTASVASLASTVTEPVEFAAPAESAATSMVDQSSSVDAAVPVASPSPSAAVVVAILTDDDDDDEESSERPGVPVVVPLESADETTKVVTDARVDTLVLDDEPEDHSSVDQDATPIDEAMDVTVVPVDSDDEVIRIHLKFDEDEISQITIIGSDDDPAEWVSTTDGAAKTAKKKSKKSKKKKSKKK